MIMWCKGAAIVAQPGQGIYWLSAHASDWCLACTDAIPANETYLIDGMCTVANLDIVLTFELFPLAANRKRKHRMCSNWSTIGDVHQLVMMLAATVAGHAAIIDRWPDAC